MALGRRLRLDLPADELQEIRHPQDGVLALPGRRAVAGASGRRHGKAHAAFVRHDQVQLGRLAHDGRGKRGSSIEQGADPAKLVLLVHHCRQQDIGGRGTKPSEFGQGQHHGGQGALGVAGAPTVQPTVADPAGEGVRRHVPDFHRVHVRFEQERP